MRFVLCIVIAELLPGSCGGPNFLRKSNKGKREAAALMSASCACGAIDADAEALGQARPNRRLVR